MRILIAVGNRFLMGGTEHHVRRLIPALRARGHELALVVEREGSASQPTIDAAQESLPCWCYRSEAGPLLPPELHSWKPDIVYVHGLADPGLEAALVEQFPAVLCAHNYYGTCISGNKYHAWPTPQCCTRRFGPTCLALYLPRRCGGRNPVTMWQEYGRQGRRHAALARYRLVLVFSRHMQAEYARHGIEPQRLHRVPHFPATARPQPEPPAPRAPSGRVLLTGRLTRLKGGHVLVEALALLGRTWSLVVAGDGPESEALQALARRKGVAAEFLGRVDDDAELERQRRAADLVAVPSLWPEPFGIVGIEAGCVGLPAVGFLNGGIAEWLIPGETGEAAPADWPTAAALAEAITRSVADPEHYQRLRLGAWRMAQRFTVERHVEQLVPLLEQACR
jgi:glycosyltransferase involved in cell wall biosynthesis